MEAWKGAFTAWGVPPFRTLKDKQNKKTTNPFKTFALCKLLISNLIHKSAFVWILNLKLIISQHIFTVLKTQAFHTLTQQVQPLHPLF